MCACLALKYRQTSQGFNETSSILTACTFIFCYGAILLPVQFLDLCDVSFIVLRVFGILLGNAILCKQDSHESPASTLWVQYLNRSVVVSPRHYGLVTRDEGGCIGLDHKYRIGEDSSNQITCDSVTALISLILLIRLAAY